MLKQIKSRKCLKLVQPNITIFYFALANEERRGAWKTLLDSECGGGNALVSRLRRAPISALKSDFQFWRGGWDSNPRAPCGTAHFECAGINHYPTPPFYFYLYLYSTILTLKKNLGTSRHVSCYSILSLGNTS